MVAISSARVLACSPMRHVPNPNPGTRSPEGSATVFIGRDYITRMPIQGAVARLHQEERQGTPNPFAQWRAVPDVFFTLEQNPHLRQATWMNRRQFLESISAGLLTAPLAVSAASTKLP